MTDDQGPYGAFRFKVEIVGMKVVGGFNEVSGLNVENEIETFREGGRNEIDHQLLGPAKFSSRLTMKRGIAAQDKFWEWYVEVMQGIIHRRNLAVSMSDDGKSKFTWKFAEACPVKWSGPALQAGGSAVAFETIELVHRGCTVEMSSA